MVSFENLINKGGLRTTVIRRLRDYSIKPPELLWSRGWSYFADHAGDDSFLYPAYPTRYCVSSLSNLRGASGLIWLRAGNYPIREDWYQPGSTLPLGDIATFARDVVNYLGGSTVLLTTDGDMSIPGDLPDGVAESILSDSNIRAWFTQNYDGSLSNNKLRSLPIGLGLHAGGVQRFSGVFGNAKHYTHLKDRLKSKHIRENRVWSDTHLRSHPGFHGDPRAILASALNELQFNITDYPAQRLTQSDIWKKYLNYKFVVSLPGHGLDCYRTWEALGLGAIVITVHSPLDDVLKPYRVIFIEAKEPKDWLILNDLDWLASESEKCIHKPLPPLDWDHWLSYVRAPLGLPTT